MNLSDQPLELSMNYEKPTVNIMGFNLIMHITESHACSNCFFENHSTCNGIECIYPDDVYFTHPDGLVYSEKTKTSVDPVLMKKSEFYCMFDGNRLFERHLGFLECDVCSKRFLPIKDSDAKKSLSEA